MKKLIFLLICVNLAGCGSGGRGGYVPTPPGETPISEGVLSGKFQGDGWEFVSGRVRVDPFDSSKYLYELWNVTPLTAICDVFTNVQDAVIFSIPKVEATILLSNLQTVSFNRSINGHTTVVGASVGKIIINNIDSVQQKISGSLRATGDVDSFVDGHFSATLCP